MFHVLFSTTVLALVSSVATAETITVCLDGSCDYTDIQAAIDSANDGDVIEIAAGTYYPAATIDTLGKAVTLFGAVDKDGAPATVIDAEGLPQALQCSSGEDADTVLQNLLLTGGVGLGGMSISDSSSPTLMNCTFADNLAYFEGGGMRISDSSDPTLTNCTFSGNSTGTNGGGVQIENYCYPSFTNCVFRENLALRYNGKGGGIHCTVWSHPTFDNCVIQDNWAGLAGSGIWSEESGLALGNTTICSNTTDQVIGEYIDNGGNCITTNCPDAEQDGKPAGCGVPVDLQAMIEAAAPGETVTIPAGNHQITRTLDPQGKAIKIQGEVDADGNPITIIDAVGAMRVAQCTTEEGPNTVFEDLVFTGGSTFIYKGSNLDDGAGMLCEGSSPTLKNCVFMANHGTNRGGGMCCRSGASPRLEDCVFSGNTCSYAGAGLAVWDTASQPVLENCRFTGNVAADPQDTGLGLGGAMACYLASPQLNNCVFEENISYGWGLGGAVYVEGTNCNPAFTGCAFTENLASGTNAYGGGMCISGNGIEPLPSPVLIGCSFSRNACVGGSDWQYGENGGGIGSFSGTNPVLSDTVFCGNTPNQRFGPYTNDGGICFAFSCTDSDDNGIPDECEDTNPDILQVPSEYPTIASAVAAAGYADTIEIAKGTYQPSATLDLQGKPITLRGAVDEDGYPTTIIDGQYEQTVFMCMHGEGNDTVFENLLITRGEAQYYYGGGMYLAYESSPTLINCVFLGNIATYSGGGMVCSTNCNPILDNCVFQSNSSSDVGGGIYGSGSTLTDTIICGNFPNQISGTFNDDGGNCIQEFCIDCETVNCPTDLNGDGVTNGEDLGLLFVQWGDCPACPADLNGDGEVNGEDLGLFFAAWGPCL